MWWSRRIYLVYNWLSEQAQMPFMSVISILNIHSRSALRAVKGPRLPQTALHTPPNYLPSCARGLRAEHRKEGNHTNLNNAGARSLHYDLVNGWLYKHSDPSELPCLTAQSAWWTDQLSWTHLLLPWPQPIQCFNFVQLQGKNSEATGCVTEEVIWDCEEIPHSDSRELKRPVACML